MCDAPSVCRELARRQGVRQLGCIRQTPYHRRVIQSVRHAVRGWGLDAHGWYYYRVGRLDDVLIHSSGEKTVPAPMETSIGSSEYLSGLCMFGRGRSQTGVLVEPRPEYAIDVTDDQQVAEFRNMIWCVAGFPFAYRSS